MDERIISVELVKDTEIDADVSRDTEIDAEVSDYVREGTTDYEKLSNLPSINGTPLIGNYDECDPTVPDWAKDDTKPAYTTDEIGAINTKDEVSFADIKEMWDTIFNQ
jgi:hypothetical protein